MSSSNSVLRRYTPPTCTLEITASGSPLSRWLGRPAIKQLQFQLSLDDPRLPEEKRLTIKGDKTQLEALREAVETYVQDFLTQPPETSRALLPPAATDTADDLHPEAPSANLISDTTNDQEEGETERREDAERFPSFDPSTQPSSPPEFIRREEENSSFLPPVLAGNIYLQPDGMLAHNLYLGSLATPESGQVVRLSTLQLFDLATAFEQYAEELVVLPNLKGAQRKGFAAKLIGTPVWAKTAAGLVLVAGATAAGVQLLNRNTPIQTADAPAVSPNPTPTEQPAIATIPSPSPTLVVPTPPLSSTPILPTPTLGAGGSPSPNASLPFGTGVSPNLLPGATPSPTPSPTLGAGVTPSPAIGSPTFGTGATPSPTTPSSNLRSGVPPAPAASPSLPSGGSPASRSPSGSYKIPLQFDTPRPTTAPTPLPTQPPRVQNDAGERSQSLPQASSRPSPSPAVTVNPDRVASSPNRVRERTSPGAVRSAATPNPTFFPRPDETPKAPPSPARVRAAIPAPTIQPPPAIPTPRFVTPTPIPTPAAIARPTIPTPAAAARPTIPTPAAAAPPAIPAPDFPSTSTIPTPMAAAPAVIPTPTPTATNPEPSVAALRSAPTPQPETNRIPAAERDNTSAFAPIPQVGEVERYFRQRWQPPSTLTQDIEYTLSLNPDGSIKSVTPRGQTAEIYLDRTEMPLVGEPFVSPIEGGRNTTIILVLSKDGKVQAFLGPSN
ncbi:MAG TPA: hypothetical protein DCY88_21385 [Cyanobacteria bacterium UBA11372]|nr:hypothetical protein [Cyanobacteria bacterium UBA11372]